MVKWAIDISKYKCFYLPLKTAYMISTQCTLSLIQREQAQIQLAPDIYFTPKSPKGDPFYQNKRMNHLE